MCHFITYTVPLVTATVSKGQHNHKKLYINGRIYSYNYIIRDTQTIITNYYTVIIWRQRYRDPGCQFVFLFFVMFDRMWTCCNYQQRERITLFSFPSSLLSITTLLSALSSPPSYPVVANSSCHWKLLLINVKKQTIKRRWAGAEGGEFFPRCMGRVLPWRKRAPLEGRGWKEGRIGAECHPCHPRTWKNILFRQVSKAQQSHRIRRVSGHPCSARGRAKKRWGVWTTPSKTHPLVSSLITSPRHGYKQH